MRSPRAFATSCAVPVQAQGSSPRQVRPRAGRVLPARRAVDASRRWFGVATRPRTRRPSCTWGRRRRAPRCASRGRPLYTAREWCRPASRKPPPPPPRSSQRQRSPNPSLRWPLLKSSRSLRVPFGSPRSRLWPPTARRLSLARSRGASSPCGRWMFPRLWSPRRPSTRMRPRPR